MKLKICGMKYPDNLSAVASHAPDYLGFIFYEKSPRYMANTLTPADTRRVPDTIRKIGVFVNAPSSVILAQVERFGLQGVQLHGSEPPELCGELKGANVLIVKALPWTSNREDQARWEAYQPYVDYFLFDTPTPQHGGSGRAFDWAHLASYRLSTPFFLSGGIGLDNVDQALRLDHPNLVGIDVNSRFETAPGRKSIDQLQQLIARLGR